MLWFVIAGLNTGFLSYIDRSTIIDTELFYRKDCATPSWAANASDFHYLHISNIIYTWISWVDDSINIKLLILYLGDLICIEIIFYNEHSFNCKRVIALMFDHKPSPYFQNTHIVAFLWYLSKQPWFMITQPCPIVSFKPLHKHGGYPIDSCIKPVTKPPPYCRVIQPISTYDSNNTACILWQTICMMTPRIWESHKRLVSHSFFPGGEQPNKV